MIKIGDKIKFNEYIPYNYINGRRLVKEIGSSVRTFRTSTVHDRRKYDITIYKEYLIKSEIPLSGIYIGSYYKKLNRIYKRHEFTEEPNDRLMTPEEFSRLALRRWRPSKNPYRLDDPRRLDKMAMIKVGRKMIGVPMINIIKNNSSNTFKVI